MKLAIERRKKEQEELESCSFAPNLKHQGHKEAPKVKSSGQSAAQPPQQKTGKIPLPPRVFESQNVGSMPHQGGFSYDTPYVESCAHSGYVNGSHFPSYGDEYTHQSYGAATKLDFGADDEAEFQGTDYADPAPASYTAPFILGGSNTTNAAASEVTSGEMNSPPPAVYPANGYKFEANVAAEPFDDEDEYVVEFELDESGAVINTGSFQRYPH